MRKIIASIAAVLFVTALSIEPASAHSQLVSMTPAQDSVSSSAPTKVVLTFGEKISLHGDELTVSAPDGSRVDVGTPMVSNTELSVNLAPITLNGHYLVDYRVVSADGHPVEGIAGFDVLIESLAATAKAKIDVNSGRENKIDKGEGRSGVEDNDLAIVYYVLFAVLLGSLFIYWRRRLGRNNRTSI